MTRSLKHYHMGCGENLSSSNWLMLVQQVMQVKIKTRENIFATRTRQKKKS